ncbi:MAG: response regulator transcription factor [Clostridiales bacterium]|nr:response regulator transcription factor [Clostridiales bacterium]
MPEAKILIVEDEQAITNFLTAVLQGEGYSVVSASSGEEAMLMAASHMPGLILLDLGLPDMDGREVLRYIREWSDIPVLVVSAHQEENDRIACLDAGANDFIPKPFGNGELLARIRSSLRQREKTLVRYAAQESSYTNGGLRIQYARREVSADGVMVHLTPIEYKLLVLFARRPGVVLTHAFILEEIWGPFAKDSQLLRVNMANIRRKIEANPGDPRYIQTVIGVGYRMADG